MAFKRRARGHLVRKYVHAAALTLRKIFFGIQNVHKKIEGVGALRRIGIGLFYIDKRSEFADTASDHKVRFGGKFLRIEKYGTERKIALAQFLKIQRTAHRRNGLLEFAVQRKSAFFPAVFCESFFPHIDAAVRTQAVVFYAEFDKLICGGFILPRKGIFRKQGAQRIE